MIFPISATYLNSRRLTTLVRSSIFSLAVGLLTASSAVHATDSEQPSVRINLSENGSLSGRVITMLDSEEAPVVARVSLSADGKTVATSTTDVIGQFSFQDVEPGVYKMVGVSGEYVGGQTIVVGEAEDGSATEVELRVSVATATTSLPSFSNAPMSSYSPSVAIGGSGYASTCACGSGGSAGGSVSRGFGGAGFGGGSVGGGRIVSRGAWGASSLRRLMLLGGAVAVPVAVSNDEVASPDQ